MHLTPSDVLDMQGYLKGLQSTPATIRYVDRFIASATATEHHQWLFPPGVDGPEFCRREELRLSVAYAFQVTPNMCDLVRWAAASLPENSTFYRETMPSPQGFVWFDTPIEQLDLWGKTTKTSAISWGVTNEEAVGWIMSGEGVGQTETVRHFGSQPGVRINFYNDIREVDDTTKKLMEKYNPEAVRAPGYLQLQHSNFFPFGSQVQARFSPALLAEIESLNDLPVEYATSYGTFNRVVALWLLLGQSISASHEGEIDRAARKRAGRMKIPSRVTVVELRRRTSSPSEGESHVEWHHQWIVRGHWRNQPYPSKGTHELIWIHPYVKGPEGAPLIQSEKVYRLSR